MAMMNFFMVEKVARGTWRVARGKTNIYQCMNSVVCMSKTFLEIVPLVVLAFWLSRHALRATNLFNQFPETGERSLRAARILDRYPTDSGKSGHGHAHGNTVIPV